MRHDLTLGAQIAWTMMTMMMFWLGTRGPSSAGEPAGWYTPLIGRGFAQLIFHGRASLGSRVAWLSGLDHFFLCSFFLSLLFLLIAGRISALRLACIRGLFGKTCHLFGVPCAVLSGLNVTICLMRITRSSSCYWQKNVRMPSISVQLAW